MTLLASQVAAATTVELLTAIARILGLAAAAGALSAGAAFVFRWYANQRVPLGVSVLVGAGLVAAWLNTRTALGQVLDGSEPVSATVALFNIGAFVAAAFASAGGQRLGDRLAIDFVVTTGAEAVDASVSRVVQAVGRVITVELPADIDDIVGYDPVAANTKAKLEGQTLVFPRRLTVSELRERLVARLKSDYGAGHIDLELDEDGQVTYLALGQRAAGIGPSLPPESVAVAIRADPANAASAGDMVQVWAGDGSQRICNAEIRGTAGELVTVVVDASDAAKFDRETTYRLVTLAVDARPDREFASLLRAADETMGVVTIGAESPLAGTPIGALDVVIIAVAPATEGERVETLPHRDRVLVPGESLYIVATPDALRKVEGAAAAARPADGADL